MTETPLPPKPGHTITFTMPTSLSTVAVNRLIQTVIDDTIIAYCQTPRSLDAPLRSATANRRRDPAQHGRPACYVHGFGTDLRDTLVARYTPVTGEVIVHYPPNYWGPDHPSTTDWLRARVAVWDALLFALGGPSGAGGVTKSVT